jgi:hypothetical protein
MRLKKPRLLITDSAGVKNLAQPAAGPKRQDSILSLVLLTGVQERVSVHAHADYRMC